MDEQTITKLQRLLLVDPKAGLALWRKHFLDHLDLRQFDECETLLEILGGTPAVTLHHAQCHYRAVLLSEQRQFDQAEVILRALLAEELTSEQRARSLMELAIQLDELGQWPEAERFFQEALAAYKQNHDDLGIAKAASNLGVSICFQVEQGACDSGRLGEAIDYYRRALDLVNPTAESLKTARYRHGLGRIYSLLGQYEQARSEFESCLKLSRQTDNEHMRSLALLDMAAKVHLPQEQWAQADAALDAALTILQRFQDGLNMAEALTYRGNLRAQQGQIEGAQADYDQAITWAESIRIRLTSPTAQAEYRTTSEFIYTAPVSLHLYQGNATMAFTAAERARSRVLVDLLAGQHAQPHKQIPALYLEQQQALRQQLDRAYADATSPQDLEALERALAQVDRQIEVIDPAYAALNTIEALTTEEVQARLPLDAVLLTYVGDADDRLWILVVTKVEIRAVPINNPSISWLHGFLIDHLDGTRQGALVPDPQTGHLAPLTLFNDLYKVFLAPVMDLLESVQTVYVAPFGPLHYIPIGALTPDANTSPPLLTSGRRVVYTPSATVLLNYCHTHPPSSRQGVLAVAPHDERLRFIQGAAQTLIQDGNGEMLIGLGATRHALLRKTECHRILCFLGHAHFDRQYPMASRLELSDGALRASEILRELRLQTDLVILAACESGRGHILRGDEILGLSRALLYAGTPSLLVTLWPVHEIPTRLLVETFIQQLRRADSSGQGFDPAQTLVTLQNWLRTLTYAAASTLLAKWEELSSSEIKTHLTALWQMTHPGEPPQGDSQLFAHPFFWSPYILIGEPHRNESSMARPATRAMSP